MLKGVDQFGKTVVKIHQFRCKKIVLACVMTGKQDGDALNILRASTN